MKFIKSISLLLFIILFGTEFSSAQEVLNNDSVEQETEVVTDLQDDIDSESVIVEPETEQAQQNVDIVNNILDIVSDMEEQDTLEFHFAVFSGDSVITEYEDMTQTSMIQKFDVIKAKDQEDYDFTFIRQTIYNENHQAWDYIYERIYNQDGKLIFFVRKYNTYNSSCAEVAFERSEYYYSEQGQLSKKTYEIFDSNNNALDLDNCWMQRETYEQYQSYSEFISKYPLPI